jgi:hypothetical protein
MSRRLFPFAELIFFAGILASGYVIVASTNATAVPVAATARPDKQPAASEAANPAAAPAPTMAPTPAPRTRISSAKPPVPLRTDRHVTYWVEDPRKPTATSTEGAAALQTEKKAASDAAAKAMIEADGYKNVRSLARGPDGSWRGLAMRGAVEIAVILDANGRVMAD